MPPEANPPETIPPETLPHEAMPSEAKVQPCLQPPFRVAGGMCPFSPSPLFCSSLLLSVLLSSSLLLSTFYLPPSTFHLLPSTFYFLPSTFYLHLLPSTLYLPPRAESDLRDVRCFPPRLHVQVRAWLRRAWHGRRRRGCSVDWRAWWASKDGREEPNIYLHTSLQLVNAWSSTCVGASNLAPPSESGGHPRAEERRPKYIRANLFTTINYMVK